MSAGGRGGVAVCAADGVYERPTRVWTSYELSQDSIPNGFVEFIKAMALPIALVAALTVGVIFPEPGILAKQAGAVTARGPQASSRHRLRLALTWRSRAVGDGDCVPAHRPFAAPG